MKRRSKVGGKALKSPDENTRKPKQSGTGRQAAPRTSSTVGQVADIQQLIHERDEALEQQAATSDLLQLISSSPSDLQPVFAAIIEKATRLCEAAYGTLWLYENNGQMRMAALHGQLPGAFRGKWGVGTLHRPSSSVPTARAFETRKPVQIKDLKKERAYIERDPLAVASVDVGGIRSLVAVPMLKGAKMVVGAITIYRQEVRPFTDKQVELVQNFAAQAVIAIENARLLNELRQRTTDLTERTADLTEALERQTATSEVLQVISSSPGDLEPVFASMLANAIRICDAQFGNIYRWEGETLHSLATHNTPSAFAEARQRIWIRPGGKNPLGQMIATKKLVHTIDMAATESYADREPVTVAAVELGGARTLLAVPMLKENQLVGAFTLAQHEVRPFTDKQIALVENFAAQAVIAIENARLLTELRQRTDDLIQRTTDLTNALDQQTATSDVLKVISSSPSDLQPVFDTMLANATRLCEATHGHVWTFDGEQMYAVAVRGDAPFVKWLQDHNPVRPIPGSAAERIVRGGRLVHVTDRRQEPAYRDNQTFRGLVDTSGIRASLSVALRKGEKLLGMINVYRQDVRPFTVNQIKLVEDFASQAVIAIENARLLNELRQSLEQQTATADVLKVISRSTFDLQAVLDTLVQSAASLCEADTAAIARQGDDGAFHQMASCGYSAESHELMTRHPIPAGRGSITGRVIEDRQVVQIADAQSDPEYALQTIVKVGALRTMLGVPLLRENSPIGVLVLSRKTVRPFTDKQIELSQTFADQAVIAIENARLLTELRHRTDDLTVSLEQQTATSEVLSVISRSKFDLQPILRSVVDTAARLCRANQAVIFRLEGGVYRFAAGYSIDPAYLEIERQTPIYPGSGTLVGRTAMSRQVARIDDAWTDPLYEKKEDAKIGGHRSMIGVPLMREGEPVGVIGLSRSRVDPFSEREIELVTTFADQAVIAIENVRLFESVEARTRELAKSLEDLRTAQDRLVQTEKLASLGQLTAGIAHEIKNPLNFVNNFSAVSVELIDELRDALSSAHLSEKQRVEINEIADMLQGNLDKVVQHGKRADAIVKNMLLHSRQGSGEHRPVDINALVEESLNLAYHGARAEKQGFNITLEKSFDPVAGQADLFPQEITRVLLNLIANGFYAATKRKAETNGGEYEPMLTASTKNLGDRVEIRIRDNGVGIPPEVKEKMFNPFFTTKPAGEGTGLGLSISHDIIVKQHGGSIEVDTQPGEFTEFRIVLPRSAATGARQGERA